MFGLSFPLLSFDNGSDVPETALLDAEGEPLLDANGAFIYEAE